MIIRLRWVSSAIKSTNVSLDPQRSQMGRFTIALAALVAVLLQETAFLVKAMGYWFGV